MTLIRTLTQLLTTMALLALPGMVLACQYDRDCRPGVKCVKARGNLYGTCRSVGVAGDSRASLDEKGKLDIQSTYSRSCRLEADCPLDYRCSRASGASNGICVRTGLLLPGSIKSDAPIDPKAGAKTQ